MKVLLGTLCAVTFATALLAGYAAYEQRQNAQQLTKLQRGLKQAESRLSDVENNVGDPSDFWGGMAGGLAGDTLSSQVGDVNERVDQLCSAIESIAC